MNLNEAAVEIAKREKSKDGEVNISEIKRVMKIFGQMLARDPVLLAKVLLKGAK